MNREDEERINNMDKLLKLIFDCIPEYEYEEWAVIQYKIEDLYTNTIYYILESLDTPRWMIIKKFDLQPEELENIIYKTFYDINLNTEYKEFYNKVKKHLREHNILLI